MLKKNDTIVVEFDTEELLRYEYCVEKEVRARKVKLTTSMEKRTGQLRAVMYDWCHRGSHVDRR